MVRAQRDAEVATRVPRHLPGGRAAPCHGCGGDPTLVDTGRRGGCARSVDGDRQTGRGESGRKGLARSASRREAAAGESTLRLMATSASSE